ncbi:conserved domain protein [Wolbachia endosymbiont of Drosophila melanogaster]|uniref:Uncharacterized protein n=1 Tax=Wolbachia pipientis TaxID=955 RepID=A0A7G5CC76_WOLPI|nr:MULTISPECIES: hypothetical protein [Wolbachia]MDE5063244.1 hypothetical protein [Wolbachia endosymbiont of Drosophila chauvacae]MDU8940767.1 hypothetical protein [Wolbachia endosymbiont of Drosophila malagassya]CDR79657.1 hypothetical protein WPAU_1306 [Wolbachia endosymbiont of Drosophila simulans wAu]BEP30551.1 MAG: hypothetical protein WBIAU1_00290 [Wolbachia endosymbiont of Drosophila biauraria]AAS14955.1 conserved domain protein [Wolbachia endosymbiont of Drosophila melanogaster]
MNEPIIGREKEIAILQDKLLSQSAEFIAVYGRRRVNVVLSAFYQHNIEVM